MRVPGGCRHARFARVGGGRNAAIGRRRGGRPAAALGVLVALSALVLAQSAAARSLSDQLGVLQPGFVTITPQILRLQRALPRATDFPATTTTPGISFLYDPASGGYERRQGPLGPAFLERAETRRKGARRAGGVVSLRALQPLRRRETCRTRSSSRFVSQAGSLIVPQRIDTRDFSLTSNVGLLLRHLRAARRCGRQPAHARSTPRPWTAIAGSSVLGNPGHFESLEGDKVGAGDLLLRAKHRFFSRNNWGLAAGLVIHLPTGNEDNFQGIGDVRAHADVHRLVGELHARPARQPGVRLDASAVQRSGFRWGPASPGRRDGG